MNISDNGKSLLKEYEALRLHAYKDAGGLLTIGYGHLLRSHEKEHGKIWIKGELVDYRDGITKEQAEDLFDQDLKPFIEVVNAVKAPLTQNQFDALCVFSFNIGTNGFLGSGVFRAASAGQYDLVPGRLTQWNKIKGKISRGLINRRNKEVSLWNKE